MALGRAETILDIAHSAFVAMDEDGLITYWNPRAEEFFGLSSAAAVGRELAATIIPEGHQESHRAGLRRFLETGEARLLDRRIELTARRADGDEFPVEVTVSAMREGESWSFFAFLADISERKAAECERERLLGELGRALEGSEARLAVIIDALAEGVTIRGPDDHIIYANRAALDSLGVGSVAELRAADPRALMSDFESFDELGQPISMDDLPSVRLLRGEDPEPLLMRTVARDAGRERWVLLKAAAVRAPNGAIEAAVTIIEDVTVSKRAELQSSFLSRASEILASSLDYEETLRNVAWLVVPEVADWCGVDLVDEHGKRQTVAVAHPDPAKLALAERLRGYQAEGLDPERGLGAVLLSGRTELYADIPSALLEAAAVDAEHLRLLRELAMRSLLIVPIRNGPRIIGAMSLVSAESGRRFTEQDVSFATQIAERAAVAVENARLYTQRSQIARTLQRSLLPEALPEIPGWELASLYRPTSTGGEVEVGGDFYDVVPTERGWLVVIGDVTGKGIEAATMTSLVRHGARFVGETEPEPAQILARLDATLRGQGTLSLCSMLCMRIEQDQICFASAGHPLPLLVTADGVRSVGRTGPVLGAFADSEWPTEELCVGTDEVMLLYTDGVTDTVGSDGRFGETRLRQPMADFGPVAPADLLPRLDLALNAFQVGSQADDTAALALRLAPAGTDGRAALDAPPG